MRETSGGPAIVTGTANIDLAEAVAGELGQPLVARTVARFPDGELHVAIEETLRGRDVYLLQPTGPPADGHLMELLFLADACRRAGAARLTAVVPYFGYARQDRRVGGRQPVGARVVADLLGTAALHRIVTVDLHASAVEGFFATPAEHLSAVPLLARAVAQAGVPPAEVIVAPDLGAVKLAERYAAILQLPIAVVHKMRLSGTEVRVRALVGDVKGRRPIVIDDMISTGGTIEAAVKALIEAGSTREISVAATHALFSGGAVERLQGLPIDRLVVTDSVPGREVASLPIERVTLAPLLAAAIHRLHRDDSLADLLSRV
ncbi:MAG TPA: ribose-phosphate pyrophosphokinase [Vicinamibacterales bacterium]|nr:ribose-phosphate pyrophosphokinase [Vicinamibacterales bacterium]